MFDANWTVEYNSIKKSDFVAESGLINLHVYDSGSYGYFKIYLNCFNCLKYHKKYAVFLVLRRVTEKAIG